MPSRHVLAEAVKKGIIEQQQADALVQLENSTAIQNNLPLKADLDAEDDEGFRFISGFNDIFLALGVVLVLYGLSLSRLSTGPLGHVLIVIILWVMGEIFSGWLKRTLPSMIVVTAFTYHVMAAASIFFLDIELSFLDLFGDWSNRVSLIPLFAIGLLAAAVYYGRFKLPFALFVSGLQIIGIVLIYASTILDETLIGYIIPLLLVTGLALFALAMWFDVSDPLRQTRMSDNAFWLHLLASPLIVHSIMWQSAIWTIGFEETNSLRDLQIVAPTLAVVVLSIFLILVVIALIIDRRAMLVSSLVYVSVAVTYFVTQHGTSLGTASLTPVLIGAAIIALGVGWRPMRQLIYTLLPLGFIEPSMPPLKN